MKRLFVIAFAVTSLLRPSLVLCVEATGDVRVEFQEATCCVSEHAVPDITFRAASAVDCDGCIDVGLATNSRLLKRPRRQWSLSLLSPCIVLTPSLCHARRLPSNLFTFASSPPP
jgi:hypothetical protein